MTLAQMLDFMDRPLSHQEVAGLADDELERLEGNLYHWHRVAFQACCRRGTWREGGPGSRFREGAGHD